YLLTSVRRVAATWTQSARREQLVDDFATFAAQAAQLSHPSDTDTLELGADVRAMHEAEQSLAMQAFRSLPERWQAVLWHTEVEDESPSEVATLFGLDANGTRVLASRAREGLKQAYLQAHVSAALAEDEGCARHADQLGTYARGRLRTRAERGLRKHLEECARCRLAATESQEVAGGIPALVPVAVIGWFGAAGYAKVAALVAGGTGAAGAAGAASAAGGGASGGAAGGLASEGMGAPAKAGIAAGVTAVAAAAAIAIALSGSEAPPEEPRAAPAPSAPVVPEEQPPPSPEDPPDPAPPAPPAAAPAPPPPAAAPAPRGRAGPGPAGGPGGGAGPARAAVPRGPGDPQPHTQPDPEPEAAPGAHARPGTDADPRASGPAAAPAPAARPGGPPVEPALVRHPGRRHRPGDADRCEQLGVAALGPVHRRPAA